LSKAGRRAKLTWFKPQRIVCACTGGEVTQRADHGSQPMALVRGPEGLKLVLVEQRAGVASQNAAEALLRSLVGAQAVNTALQIPPIVPKDFQSYLHTHGADHLIYPNTSRPIPFVNELSVGQCVWLVRTEPLSEQYKHKFEGTQYVSHALHCIAGLCFDADWDRLFGQDHVRGAGARQISAATHWQTVPWSGDHQEDATRNDHSCTIQIIA
jgi:hypothetical protein